MKERDAYWSDLLLNLSEGRPEGVATLKQMDSIEFWYFYKAWKNRQQAIVDAYNQP